MSFLSNPTLMRQIIMDHYEYPRNKGLVEDENYLKVHMDSESCIDDIYIQAKFHENLIEDVKFDGVACTIATSSTSIMSEMVKGKTKQEAIQLFNEYMKMINGETYNEDLLEEANVFCNVGKQANRIKCATIGWNGLIKLIEESK